MSLFNEILQKREENNIRLETEADRSLINNKQGIHIEEQIEDAQTAVVYILECFGLHVDRLYGFHTLTRLLDTMLDPLGMMYEYSEDICEECRTRSKYILAFREDGKAVALLPTVTGYRYYCPSSSEAGFVSKNFLSGLNKECYIFCRPLVKKKSILGSFIATVLTTLTMGDVVRLLIATGLTTLLGMAIPQASSWIYKSFINGSDHPMNGFYMALFVYLGVVVARAVIAFVKTMMLSATKLRVSMEMQSAVMAKIMHLPHSFFQDTSSGKLSRRINSCSRLSDILLDVFMDVVLNLSFSVAYLIQMRYMAPVLFVPAILFIGLKILVTVIVALVNMVNQTRLLDLDMEYTGFLYSAVRGIQKLKSLGAEIFIYSKWAEMYRRRLALTYRQPFLLKYQTPIISAVTIGTTIALLHTALESGLTSEDYLSFMSSFTLVMTVVGSLTDIMGNMFLTHFLCRNVYPIFTAETEETEALEYIRSLQGSIRTEDIWFSYEDEMRGCLKGVSLDIRRGEKLAIVGESGCGKSTLLKILIGLEKPDSGTVYYDGKLLDSLNQKSLRRCIGSVFQFSRVFPGTIAENVAFGNRENPDEKQIWEALDNAEIGDYIRKLPLGIYTEISEANSCGFSGGQRQRILLARAILDHPKVLILDEATSALDNVTQKKVLENIGKMKSTVVMVAHRLSTVQDFDRIVLLEKGCIVEEGSYEELMKRDGHFARLVRKQML